MQQRASLLREQVQQQEQACTQLEEGECPVVGHAPNISPFC